MSFSSRLQGILAVILFLSGAVGFADAQSGEEQAWGILRSAATGKNWQTRR